MKAAIDPGYAVFGQDAIYTDRDLNEVPCRVVVTHDLTRWGDTISVTSFNAMISVRRDEVSSRPRRGETFTLASTAVYRVEQVIQATEYEFMILTVEDTS